MQLSYLLIVLRELGIAYRRTDTSNKYFIDLPPVIIPLVKLELLSLARAGWPWALEATPHSAPLV